MSQGTRDRTGTKLDDADAVAGLERLGLTSYEAKVFLGLQKLGGGTASEVSEVSDVPRSQVYGAAERLEERGLVETRQSTPTAYRPVPMELARTRLLDDLQETGSRTFDYLETVGGSYTAEEETEAIWLARGTEAVSSRVADLSRSAEDHLLYATGETRHLEDPVLTALRDAADAGTTVLVGSTDRAVQEMVEGTPGLSRYKIPERRTPTGRIARTLVVDDRTILLSVFSRTATEAGTGEVAFWSEHSAFAAVLVELMDEWFEDPFAA